MSADDPQGSGTATRQLIERLRKTANGISIWRDDERQGAGDAIPLICDAEELLTAAADLLTRVQQAQERTTNDDLMRVGQTVSMPDPQHASENGKEAQHTECRTCCPFPPPDDEGTR